MNEEDENILDEAVPPGELQRYEDLYRDEVGTKGEASRETIFEYARCSVRSRYPADIRRGILLFNGLAKPFREDKQRVPLDYLYYLALGHARLYEYSKALKFLNEVQIEPSDPRVEKLKMIIKKKQKDADLAMAAVGVLGGISVIGVLALCVLYCQRQKFL